MDDTAPETLDLWTAIATTRAMRRLSTDPVPDELVRRILEAGVCAANGANRQTWRFLVVRDRAVKEAVARLYQRAFDEVVGPMYATLEPPAGVAPERYAAQHRAVEYLTEHFADAPVWIVACLEEHQRPGRGSGASIYPAVQNMLLAARALGLGSTLTTRHLLHGEEADAVFGLPDNVRSYAILPIGRPLGRFGPVGRRPLADIVHGDRWGEPYPGV